MDEKKIAVIVQNFHHIDAEVLEKISPAEMAQGGFENNFCFKIKNWKIVMFEKRIDRFLTFLKALKSQNFQCDEEIIARQVKQL